MKTKCVAVHHWNFSRLFSRSAQTQWYALTHSYNCLLWSWILGTHVRLRYHWTYQINAMTIFPIANSILFSFVTVFIFQFNLKFNPMATQSMGRTESKHLFNFMFIDSWLLQFSKIAWNAIVAQFESMHAMPYGSLHWFAIATICLTKLFCYTTATGNNWKRILQNFISIWI